MREIYTSTFLHPRPCSTTSRRCGATDELHAESMIASADVVVIGSGAFGSSTAYHLAKLGLRNVVLLDRFAPARRPRRGRPG